MMSSHDFAQNFHFTKISFLHNFPHQIRGPRLMGIEGVENNSLCWKKHIAISTIQFWKLIRLKVLTNSHDFA